MFKPGMKVIELGSYPGGWSQIISSYIGNTGKLISIDLFNMQPLKNQNNIVIKGDFTKKEIYNKIINFTNSASVDWVVSDLSPKISGISIIDDAKSIQLVHDAFNFSNVFLKPTGNFLTKLFQGKSFNSMVKDIKKLYHKVDIIKPLASRLKSREIYLIAMNKK